MKPALLAQIIAQLQAELDHLKIAVQAALAAATGEESKPENQYDTRALEASYLAAAQGKRVAELERMIHVLKSFPSQTSTVAGSGSLLEVSCDGLLNWYFLLPFGAGLSAVAEGKKVTVVSLDSPLGQLFQGKTEGSSFEFARPGGVKEFEILRVR